MLTRAEVEAGAEGETALESMRWWVSVAATTMFDPISVPYLHGSGVFSWTAVLAVAL